MIHNGLTEAVRGGAAAATAFGRLAWRCQTV